MRRSILLAAALVIPGCLSLPEPEPPPQGAYGSVRHQYVEHQDALPGVRVFAAPVALHDGDALPVSTPSTTTDANGNFSLALPEGRFRLCLGDHGVAAQCDCAIDVPRNGAAERIYQRWDDAPSIAGWNGVWETNNDLAACAAP